MSDTKEGDEAKSKAPRGKTLSLKRTVDGGQVRQSFSHGRSKSVQVETRRRRIVKPGVEDAPGGKPEVAEAATSAPAKADSAPSPAAAPADASNLSAAEQEKRRAAVAGAKVRAVEEAKQAEIDAARRAEEAAQREEEKKRREPKRLKRKGWRANSSKPNKRPAPNQHRPNQLPRVRHRVARKMRKRRALMPSARQVTAARLKGGVVPVS